MDESKGSSVTEKVVNRMVFDSGYFFLVDYKGDGTDVELRAISMNEKRTRVCSKIVSLHGFAEGLFSPGEKTDKLTNVVFETKSGNVYELAEADFDVDTSMIQFAQGWIGAGKIIAVSKEDFLKKFGF